MTGCEHCGCDTDHTRPSMTDTETTCHCGAAYDGSDHCPACGCEQYESLACFGTRDFGTSPRQESCRNCGGGPENGHKSWCGTAPGKIYDPAQQPGGPGPYTHIVKRKSGCIAGWFVGEPPARFIKECNDNVPDDPAHAEAIPPWPDETRQEIDARPQTEGNPYQAYTPESRTFEIAQAHGQLAAYEALAGVNPDVAGYRALLAAIPTARTKPSASDPKLRWDDLPGYAVADLMSQAGWVPHDGTDLRDELASQYEQQSRTAFWNEIERRCLAALPHREVDNATQLGSRFIKCACGHSTSGGIGDTIAQQNFAHHLKTAREARASKP